MVAWAFTLLFRGAYIFAASTLILLRKKVTDTTILPLGLYFQAFRRGRPWYANYIAFRARFLKVVTVVLLKSGPFSGKIAVIAEIIDHNRVRTRAAHVGRR